MKFFVNKIFYKNFPKELEIKRPPGRVTLKDDSGPMSPDVLSRTERGNKKTDTVRSEALR